MTCYPTVDTPSEGVVLPIRCKITMCDRRELTSCLLAAALQSCVPYAQYQRLRSEHKRVNQQLAEAVSERDKEIARREHLATDHQTLVEKVSELDNELSRRTAECQSNLDLIRVQQRTTSTAHQEMMSRLAELFSQDILQKTVAISDVDGQLILKLDEALLFGEDSAALTESGRQTLKKVRDPLKNVTVS